MTRYSHVEEEDQNMADLQARGEKIMAPTLVEAPARLLSAEVRGAIGNALIELTRPECDDEFKAIVDCQEKIERAVEGSPDGIRAAQALAAHSETPTATELSVSQGSPVGHGALPMPPAGEEFLEFKEALADLRALRHEYDCLNGGGPGWAARNKAAWARVDELFADEDEAAYDRQQEDFYG